MKKNSPVSLAHAAQADVGWLRELRAFQEKVRLDDEVALESIRDAARSHVEARLERAIAMSKRRTRVRDFAELVQVRWVTVQQSLCPLSCSTA